MALAVGEHHLVATTDAGACPSPHARLAQPAGRAGVVLSVTGTTIAAAAAAVTSSAITTPKPLTALAEEAAPDPDWL